MCVLYHIQTHHSHPYTQTIYSKKCSLNDMYNKERSKYVSSKYNDNDYFALLCSMKQKYYLINYTLQQ